MNWNQFLLFFKQPWRIVNSLNNRGLFNFIPDSLILRMQYKSMTGLPLDLENPQTFNEKIQWLKLNDRNPLYTMMVDKYEVKKYVIKAIGEKYVIPTYGIWDNFDDIDFDLLPNKVVLKCTHNSGCIAIVRDKSQFNPDSIRTKFETCLRNNYYYSAREWPYKNVKPRIIAEKYMQDESGYELKDYKIFNFNGTPKLIQVDFDRFSSHKRNLYTPTWEYIDASIQYPNVPERIITRPQTLEEMLDLARKLSKDIPHVRTDFYCIEDKVYFGEMTFYHESGFGRFTPQSFGKTMGSWLQLPR